MQVSELIELLKEMPQDAEVHFTYNYGDHWRTQVAPKVRDIYEGAVKYSGYHQMDKVVEFDYDEEDEQEEGNSVVLLGC